MNRWNIEDFQGSENTLYDIIMRNTCHYVCHSTYIQTQNVQFQG